MEYLTSLCLGLDIHDTNMNHPETRRIQLGVEAIVRLLFAQIAKEDPRFKQHNIHQVGSYYDGTKLSTPDEFDFLIELEQFINSSGFTTHPPTFATSYSPKVWSNLRQFQKVELLDEKLIENWKNDACKNVGTSFRPRYFLDQVKFKNKFYFTLCKAWNILKNKLPRHFEAPDFEIFGSGPALALNLMWRGRKFPNLAISVDLTIAIPVVGWPEEYDFQEIYAPGTIARDCFVDLVNRYSYHLVPYTKGEGDTMECVWKISSSLIENKFFSTLPNSSKPKTIMRVLKKVKEQFFDFDSSKFYSQEELDKGEHGKFSVSGPISSYMIRQSLLHVMSSVPSEEWKNQKLGFFFLLVFNRIFKILQTQKLTDFFISKHILNLPEKGDKAELYFNAFIGFLEHTFVSEGKLKELEEVKSVIPDIVNSCAQWEMKQRLMNIDFKGREDLCSLSRNLCHKYHGDECLAKKSENTLAKYMPLFEVISSDEEF